jgi:hypothetical protein
MAGEGAVRWRYLGGRENGCPHTKEFKLKPRALDNAAKAFDFLHAKRVRVELWLCAVAMNDVVLMFSLTTCGQHRPLSRPTPALCAVCAVQHSAMPR